MEWVEYQQGAIGGSFQCGVFYISALQELPWAPLNVGARHGLNLRQVLENQGISIAFSFVLSLTSDTGLSLSKICA